MHAVTLSMLRRIVRFESRDETLIHLLTVLWHPFVTGEGVEAWRTIAIEPAGSGWTFTDGSHAKECDDIWILFIELRAHVVEAALEASPEVVDLHAAVLVRDDAALLLAGDPGAGKTSMALLLIGYGWSYFSDDIAPIEINSGAVLPFPKPLGIKWGDWTHFGTYWGEAAELLPPPTRAFLLPPPQEAIAPLSSAAPKGLVFLHFEPDAPTSTKPLTRAEAITRAGRQARRLDPQTLQKIVRLCDQTEHLALTYNNPSTAGERLRLFGDALVSRK